MDTVTILTCAANGTVAPLHDRMPVVLEPEQHDDWLDVRRVNAERALAIIAPAADDLFQAVPLHPQAVPLHPKVNKTQKDEPDDKEPPQLSLL